MAGAPPLAVLLGSKVCGGDESTITARLNQRKIGRAPAGRLGGVRARRAGVPGLPSTHRRLGAWLDRWHLAAGHLRRLRGGWGRARLAGVVRVRFRGRGGFARGRLLTARPNQGGRTLVAAVALAPILR